MPIDLAPGPAAWKAAASMKTASGSSQLGDSVPEPAHFRNSRQRLWSQDVIL